MASGEQQPVTERVPAARYGRCTRAQRGWAIAASAVAAALLFMALTPGPAKAPDIAASGGAGAGSGGGIGTGTGSGIGPGEGTGSGHEGTGPGAGEAGSGRGSSGPDAATPPAGEPTGEKLAQAENSTEASGAAEGADDRSEPLDYGFTLADEQADGRTVGLPDGGPSQGAQGKAGGGGDRPVEFMGVKTKGVNVVYVVDFSGSMQGERFEAAKKELKRSIGSLPTKGSFLVIFFDEACDAMPPGELVKASSENKLNAYRWIAKASTRNGTDPAKALELALSLKPSTIFLMTDGAFDEGPTMQVIAAGNQGSSTVINTIAFHERSGEAALKRIAADNRGDYRYVPPPKQGKRRP